MANIHKLRKTTQRLNVRKEDVRTHVPANLGLTIGGSKVVEISTREGYHYARIRGNLNEVAQVYNVKTSPVYDLPVLITYKNNRWEVEGTDTGRYTSWGTSAYLPKHGAQHSFDPDAPGGDPVWVWGRQMMPLAAIPSGSSGGPNVLIEPSTYWQDNSWHYAGGTGTADITGYKPTGSNARMVLVYLDGDGNPQLLAGDTYFNVSLTGTSQVVPYIPAMPNTDAIGIAGVRLVSGTSTITWNNIYDLRPWIVGSGYIPTGTSGVTDHGALTGLLDNDHPQYLLTGTSVGVTDHGLLTGLLDNDHPQYRLTGTAISHLELSDLNSAIYTHLTATNHTDLTDGGATTLHKHDHGSLDGLTDNDHPQYLLTGTAISSTDEKAKVSSNDTTAGYLNGKLVEGAGISLTEVGDGTNETLRISYTGTASSGAVTYPAIYDDNTFKATGSAIHFNDGLNVIVTGSSAWIDWTGSAGGVTDHGALTGLLDNDHPQYQLTGTIVNGDGKFFLRSNDASKDFFNNKVFAGAGISFDYTQEIPEGTFTLSISATGSSSSSGTTTLTKDQIAFGSDSNEIIGSELFTLQTGTYSGFPFVSVDIGAPRGFSDNVNTAPYTGYYDYYYNLNLVTDNDAMQVPLAIWGFGNDPYAYFNRVGGTFASPTALAQYDYLGVIAFSGYDGTYMRGGVADITIYASDNWSTSARPVAMDFNITTTGGSPRNPLSIYHDVVEITTGTALNFGFETTNGSWRTIRDGDNLAFQRRESGAWVTKGYPNTGTAGGGVTDHGALTGLLDNDHPQYMLTGTAVSGTDEKAKVSANDTTAGYLNGKLVAGTNITLTEVDDAGNETLRIDSASGGGGGGSYPVIYDDGVFKVTGTAISFDDGLSVSVTGSIAYVSTTGTTETGKIALRSDDASKDFFNNKVFGGNGIQLDYQKEIPEGTWTVSIRYTGSSIDSLPYLSYYDPRVSPGVTGTYDDEFDDDVISGWQTTGTNESFDLLQTDGTKHASESIMHGYLMLQGLFLRDGTYNFYKDFTPAINQAFTVVCKVDLGFAPQGGATEDFFFMGIRGAADNTYYEIRLGRRETHYLCARCIYANGGAAAEGTNKFIPLGDMYVMISYDGAENFSSFVSIGGKGWMPVELNRALSNFNSFTRLGFGTISNGITDGIAVMEFVRYFTAAGQYKIGKDI